MAVMQRIKDMFLPDEFVVREIAAPASPTTYQIYPLTIRDLREVLRLNLRCFSRGENYTKTTFKYLLTESNVLSYRIDSAENHLVGFVFIVTDNQHVGHITSIGVAPEHRNRGLAKKLLLHAEKALYKRGFDTVVLEVRVSNYIAQNLYHRLGYDIIQKINRYYCNGEAAYLMAKTL